MVDYGYFLYTRKYEILYCAMFWHNVSCERIIIIQEKKSLLLYKCVTWIDVLPHTQYI